MAHKQASKGVSNLSNNFRAVIMRSVIGGLGGLERRPACKRSSPRRDQLIRLWSSSDSGAGQPCAMCHARTADRYLRVVVTAMGSSWVSFTISGGKSSGVAEAHRANECKRLNEAGKRAASGMENVSQKMWYLRKPAP